MQKVRFQIFLLILLFSSFLLFFYAVSLSRYYIFQLFYYDFGIFADIIWQASQFKIPTISHIGLGDIVFLGDHFNPSLILLSPLFWIAKDIRILLLEQALVTVLSGFVVYLIGKKSKFPFFISLAFSLLYLLFVGIQSPLVTDWHPEPTAGFFLLLFFYFFLFAKRKLWYILSATIFLGFKESNALTLLFLFTSLFFIAPNKRKELLFLSFFSISWFFLCTRVFIPYFAKKTYYYFPELPGSIGALFKNLLSAEKGRMVFQSLLSFGFLPLLGGPFLLPIIGELAIRFVPTTSFFQNFTLNGHYNVYLGIFLILASLHAFKTLQTRIKNIKLQYLLLCILLLCAVITDRKLTFAPINLMVNPVFWQELKPRDEMQKIMASVPKEGSIVAQNNLASYVLLRKGKTYLFTEKTILKQPNIVLIDMTPGQNINNYYPMSIDDMYYEIDLIKKGSIYKRIPLKKNNIYLFVKKPV